MNNNVIMEKLTEIFQDLFDDECEIHEDTTSMDVEGWDSLSQITLIATIEEEFGIKIPSSKISSLKRVGDIVQTIEDLMHDWFGNWSHWLSG